MSRKRTVTLETLHEYYEQRDRALEYTRKRWREGIGVVRTLAVMIGGLMFGAWWAQDEPYRQPLSINLHGEQAMAVVGLGLLIFGLGAWLGLHLPSSPSERAERMTAEKFEDNRPLDGD